MIFSGYKSRYFRAKNEPVLVPVLFGAFLLALVILLWSLT